MYKLIFSPEFVKDLENTFDYIRDFYFYSTEYY